jgi:hypothetical protein
MSIQKWTNRLGMRLRQTRIVASGLVRYSLIDKESTIPFGNVSLSAGNSTLKFVAVSKNPSGPYKIPSGWSVNKFFPENDPTNRLPTMSIGQPRHLAFT